MNWVRHGASILLLIASVWLIIRLTPLFEKGGKSAPTDAAAALLFEADFPDTEEDSSSASPQVEEENTASSETELSPSVKSEPEAEPTQNPAESAEMKFVKEEDATPSDDLFPTEQELEKMKATSQLKSNEFSDVAWTPVQGAEDVDLSASGMGLMTMSPLRSFSMRNGIQFGMSKIGVKNQELRARLITESSERLLYIADVEGMPCLLQYVFTPADQLTRMVMMFGDSRLHEEIPFRTNAELLGDYYYLQKALTRKYGSSREKKEDRKVTVGSSSGVDSLLADQERIRATRAYDLEDAQNRLEIKRKEFAKKYDGWNDRDVRVKRQLVPYEKRVAETREWLEETDRQLKKLQDSKRIQDQSIRQEVQVYRYISHWPQEAVFASQAIDWEIDLTLNFNMDYPKLLIVYRRISAVSDL